MNWIIGFLKKLFPNFFKGLTTWVVGFIAPLIAPFFLMVTNFFRKVGLFFLIVAALFLAIKVFAEAIDATVGRLVEETLPEWVLIGRMLLPSNLSMCISLLIFARLKSLIFMWVHRLTEKFIHT